MMMSWPSLGTIGPSVSQDRLHQQAAQLRAGTSLSRCNILLTAMSAHTQRYICKCFSSLPSGRMLPLALIHSEPTCNLTSSFWLEPSVCSNVQQPQLSANASPCGSFVLKWVTDSHLSAESSSFPRNYLKVQMTSSLYLSVAVWQTSCFQTDILVKCTHVVIQAGSEIHTGQREYYKNGMSSGPAAVPLPPRCSSALPDAPSSFSSSLLPPFLLAHSSLVTCPFQLVQPINTSSVLVSSFTHNSLKTFAFLVSRQDSSSGQSHILSLYVADDVEALWQSGDGCSWTDLSCTSVPIFSAWSLFALVNPACCSLPHQDSFHSSCKTFTRFVSEY